MADPQAPSGPQNELNQIASEIGKQIHNAGLRVAELRKLAKEKKIFNDKTQDIQELTFSVKADLQKLNQAMEGFEAKARGSGVNKSLQRHSSNMVDTLQMRLLEVTKDFKDALEERTKSLEQLDKRRSQYGNAQNGRDPFAQRSTGGNPDGEHGGGGMQNQTQLYHTSRADQVMNVQRTIGELAQMYQKMGVMVNAQEEMISRIDHDVEDTLQNMEQGQEHLLKYFQHISSNRSMIIKVFAILIFFVVFFIVFLA